MRTYRRAIYRIEARVDGPVRARRLVARELAPDTPPPVVEDVKLLVSELVTNGIRHGSGRPRDMITVEMVIDGSIHCTVSDKGGAFAAGRRHADDDGGWGLGLVERLAKRWGLSHSGAGTSVWFEVPGPN